MAITPRAGDESAGGFVRDATYGDLAVKVNSGNVSLSTADIEVGKVKLLGSDGTTVANVLSAAPGSDTGQSAVAVRVISQLGAGSAGGGLTDTQLRASAVPVSLATNTPDVTDRAARLLGHVTVDSAPTTAVTGTFWQATQPVSMATQTPDVTDRAARLLGHVTVDSAPTTAVTGPLTDTQLRASAVPVSGTFFQATQPVSLATNTPDVTDRAARLLGVLSAGTNKIGTVDIATAPAVAKGTQGANGVPTQDLKDSGRAAITITGFQVAGIITTEALFAASLVRAADGTAAAAAAQHTVTAGKRLRIQSIMVTVKNTAAAAGTSKLALRYRPAGGTVATTDSIIAVLDIGSNGATANNYIGPYFMDLPDGFELIAASTFGFTNLSSAVTMLHTITVVGFEY